MSSVDTIIWFRQDLRLEDNPAVSSSEGGCLGVFIWTPKEGDGWNYGAASKCWLQSALVDLDTQLRERGGSLVILDATNSSSAEVLLQLTQDVSARRVVWNRRYEPAAVGRDTEIKRLLKSKSLVVDSYNARLINEPTEVANKSGKPFQVFTPFWKHCVKLDIDAVVPENSEKRQWVSLEYGVKLDHLDLLPKLPWGAEMMRHWDPTRRGALARLEKMSGGGAVEYGDLRDRPDHDGTSQLSAYLHFGQIGPRELYHALADKGSEVHSGYLRQLYWRDFAHHLMYHFPETPTRPLKLDYEMFPWVEDEEIKKRWEEGKTGYPIVDAGMRQLWETGWMHNRVRMIVGSLLVKHGLQDWMTGASWFWDTLVDADLANNTLGWQWIAGCGADASPYFRVFNPIIQGQKFDPNGDYVRRYLPELAELPTQYIHCPWDAGDIELLSAGVRLGVDYPKPFVEHSKGRERALAAYQKFKAKTAKS